MSTKDYAVRDIQEDLSRNGKCFIAFRKELNPVMRKLVYAQIRQQENLFYNNPSHANSQLVARCFFSKGEVMFENYDKYYK